MIGGPSPIHVARGMSTSPNTNTDAGGGSTAAKGRHVTPHQHKHNTRHSARKQGQHQKSSSSASTSSIFRGRPVQNSTGGIKDDYDDDDEDSPQRILLSLSKDTHSFEDKGLTKGTEGGQLQVVGGDDNNKADINGKSVSSKNSAKKQAKDGVNQTKAKNVASTSTSGDIGDKKGSKKKITKKGSKKAKGVACPPSPEGPPRIYHSHSHRRSNDPLYFDVSRSNTLAC